MHYLGLFKNQLRWPAPAHGLLQEFWQVLRCVPPIGCSAFGSSALSIDMNSCVTCDYSPVVIIRIARRSWAPWHL